MNPVVHRTGPRFECFKTREALSRRAATIIIAELGRKPGLLLCASAGGTPTGTYERLSAHCAHQPGLFKRLRIIQIDEWAGLPPGHPATCRADLEAKLISPLRIRGNRFVAFHGDAPDLERECSCIGGWLSKNGPIDICILGLGVNGHVAMNEPAQAFTPHTHVARLAASSLLHPLLRELKTKPRNGLTLGVRDILNSRKILLLVNGRQKRAALTRLLQPRVTPRFPASFVWLHPDATVLFDDEAAPDWFFNPSSAKGSQLTPLRS